MGSLEDQSQVNIIENCLVSSSRSQSTTVDPKINVKKLHREGIQTLKELHTLSARSSAPVNDSRAKDNSLLAPSLALEAMPTDRALRV